MSQATMERDTSNPFQPRTNSTVDDIASVIGFTATLRLCAWFGDQNAQLYVPVQASEDHPIARLIGLAAFKRLVEEWGNEHLPISPLEFHQEDRRNRLVRDLLRKNLGPRDIAPLVGLSERRVYQLRLHMEAAGLLPLIATEKSR